LQSVHHPDILNQQEQQKDIASIYGNNTLNSALINKAYETLKDPLKRAKYLLEESGLKWTDANQDSFPPSQELLLEVLEIQESILETNAQDLERLDEENKKRIKKSVEKLAEFFQAKDLQSARLETVKLNYWKTIERMLNDKE
jgi:molecular chaperone HscB